MTNKTELVEVRLPADTLAAYQMIARTAGVSVASVIKVVLAIRVMEPARPAAPSAEEKKT